LPSGVISRLPSTFWRGERERKKKKRRGKEKGQAALPCFPGFVQDRGGEGGGGKEREKKMWGKERGGKKKGEV